MSTTLITDEQSNDGRKAVDDAATQAADDDSTTRKADVDGATALAAGDDAESPLTTDDVFHLLQNERRRNVLKYLRETDGPVRMRDVAEQVAAWEHDTTVEGLSSDQRQRVYIPLYQSHLPKLDKAGLIEYQQNRGIVERLPLADQVDPYLDGPTTDSAWDPNYGRATGVGALLLVGAVLELPVLSVLSGIAIASIILLLFTMLTFGQYLDR